MRGAVPLLCLLGLGCFTPPSPLSERRGLASGPQDTWEDEARNKRARAPLEERQLANKNMSVKELASGFTDARTCEQAARAQLVDNAANGWALVEACVRYKGFDDLGLLLDEPWRAVVLSGWPRSAFLLTDVMARRGANLGLDLGMCRQKRVRLHSVQAAMKDPPAHAGQLLVLKGGVIEGKKTKTGMNLQLAIDDGDVEATLAGDGGNLKYDRDYVFLARFVRVKPTAVTNLFADGMAVVEILAVFEIGQATVF